MTLPTATRQPPRYPLGAFLGSRKAVNWPGQSTAPGLFIQPADKLRAYHADANEAECERQLRLLRHELEITRAKAGPHAAAVVAAQAVVDADDEDIGG